ncbi:mannose-6-phosphate isomerase [Tenacibaculum maritimum]|nr:mannose-6-phosphate isomerase [Tenacibaculum maritimum]
MISTIKTTLNMFLLKGRIQNYAWGGKKYLSKLLGGKTSAKNDAEYWLGSHKKAPSIIKTGRGNLSLDKYLKLNLKKNLGKEIATKYGRLPFLFKVLDVNSMLSIQVHPTKIEAEIGFKRENELGIPLTASYRNFKDDNHKPEIMVALSDFWLLHGFLTKRKLKNRLKNTQELSCFMKTFKKKGYFGLYKKVMELSKEEVNTILIPLGERIIPLYKKGKLHKENPDYWAAKAMKTLSGRRKMDKGIFSIYFFNLVNVPKGEAIFQKAGVPHAYLEGQNIELMANSDNVLRGGLTKKHIDVPELLKHIVFEGTIPNLLKGTLQKNGLERIYYTSAKDFELSKIHISTKEVYKAKVLTVEILLVMDGEVTILEKKSALSLVKGRSAFLKPGSDYSISTKKTAIIYKAKVPY